MSLQNLFFMYRSKVLEPAQNVDRITYQISICSSRQYNKIIKWEFFIISILLFH